MSKKINVIIGGYKAHASCVFRALKKIKSIGMIGVFTGPDDNFCLLSEKPVGVTARQSSIPVYPADKLTKDTLVSISKKTKIDILLLVEWKKILPESVFSFPELGSYNIHDSILPAYRGSSPMNWAIINGEPYAGATLYRITKNVDSGPIFSQSKFSIGLKDDARAVLNKMIKVCGEVAVSGINGIVSGKKPVIQNESAATYCAKRLPQDGFLDFNRDAVFLYNMVRALSYPFPGAYAFYNGVKAIITKASIVEKSYKYAGNIPGYIVKNKDIWILCGKGILRIEEIEAHLNGRRVTDPKKFFSDTSLRLNENRIEKGYPR